MKLKKARFARQHKERTIHRPTQRKNNSPINTKNSIKGGGMGEPWFPQKNIK